jgi:hypothetical protein
VGVAFSHHDGDKVENLIVGFRLAGQPPQGVSVTLNLEPVQTSVHYGQVYAAVPVTQPQLLENYRVRIVDVLPRQKFPKVDSNLLVISLVQGVQTGRTRAW